MSRSLRENLQDIHTLPRKGAACSLARVDSKSVYVARETCTGVQGGDARVLGVFPP